MYHIAGPSKLGKFLHFILDKYLTSSLTSSMKFGRDMFDGSSAF